MKLKDLENRVYEGRQCVRFEYTIKGEHPEENALVTFKKIRAVGATKEGRAENVWQAKMLLDKTHYMETQVYNIELTMPRHDAPLVLVCSTGLHFIQMLLKEEIQRKSVLDFAIGEAIGMDNIDREVV